MASNWRRAICWLLGMGMVAHASADLNDVQARAFAETAVTAIQSGADLVAQIDGLEAALLDLGPDVTEATRLKLHNTLSLAYFFQRDLDGVRRQADAVVALTHGQRTLERADALSLRVLYLSESGQTEASLALAEQVLALRRELPLATSKLSNELVNIGINYAELGYLQLARERMDEALAFALEYEADSDMPDLVRTNIAFVLGIGKQYAEAAAINEDVVASGRSKHPNTTVLANRLSNLAKMQMALGRFDEAAAALAEADAMLLNIAPRSIDRSRTLAGLAELSEARQDWQAALRYARESAELSRALTPDTLFDCIAHRVLALTLLRQPGASSEQLAEAEQVLSRIEPLSARLLPGNAERATILYAQGLAAQLRGDSALAIARYEAAIDVLDVQYALLGDSLLTQASFSAAFADLFDRLGQLYVDANQPAAALRTWEQFRSRQLSDRLQLDTLLGAQPGGTQYLRARRALRDEAKNVIEQLQRTDVAVRDFMQRRQSLTALLEREQALTAAFTATQPRLATLLQPAADLDTQLAELTQPVLYFAIGQQRSVMLLLMPAEPTSFDGAPEPMIRIADLPGEQALRETVDRFQILLQSPASSQSAVQDASSALYRLLWQPFAAALSGQSAVTVIADDLLHGLPFAALFDPEQQRYLVQRHAISRATALSAALAPAAKLPARARFAGVAYAAGPSKPDAEQDTRSAVAGPTLPRLQFAEAEVAEAAAWFQPHSIVHVEEAATEQAVRDLGAVDVVHFAAHVVLDPIEPLKSYLALAPAPPGDGQLRLAEVMQDLQLRTQLVVLSACDSAVGPLYPGEGLIGLSKAFTYAGAERVVATLWPVVDARSAQFMQTFYRALADQRPITAALQTAQLKALNGDDAWPARLRAWWRERVLGSPAESLHPYYWAPYVLTRGAGAAAPVLADAGERPVSRVR